MVDKVDSENFIHEQEHASLEALLCIREGEDHALSAHVLNCKLCQTRLEEVDELAQLMNQQLLFEAELPVPEAVWDRLQPQLQAEQTDSSLNTPTASGLMASQSKASIWSSINTAIYSLAAAIVFMGCVSLYTYQGNQQARVEAQALQASIRSLMDSSRGLESVLKNVAATEVTLPLAQQSAVERLQWRLMMVDQQIHESESSDQVNYEQIKALWADRIDALNELNKLYYANYVAVSDGQN